MSIWAWLGVGLGAYFLISALLSLAIAAILRSVSREAPELLDPELLARVPLPRAAIRSQDEDRFRSQPAPATTGPQALVAASGVPHLQRPSV
jgi:hypothetical protein